MPMDVRSADLTQEVVMNPFRAVTQALYAGFLMCGLMSSAGADEARSYGRAGGPVGADAIDHVVRMARPAVSRLDADEVTIYGQAGQPVGADAVTYVSRRATPSKVHGNIVLTDWYGRAGGTSGAAPRGRTAGQLAQSR